MNMSPLYRALSTAFVVGATTLALYTATVIRLRAAEKPADPPSSQLAKDLVGTWELAGTPEKPNDAPEGVRGLKFRTGKYWTITNFDKKTGVVGFHHGGTYTLDGDTYEETVEYSTENNAPLSNQKFKFTVKVEGDTFTQIGIGNPYNEVWKRVK